MDRRKFLSLTGTTIGATLAGILVSETIKPKELEITTEEPFVISTKNVGRERMRIDSDGSITIGQRYGNR